MNEKSLIAQCVLGHRESQEILFKRYADQIYGVCLKYARNATEAQDILQDSFITIFEKIESFKGKGSFAGWMKRIAINTALMKYREQKIFSIDGENKKQLELNESDNYNDIPLNVLLKYVQELPDRYRLVFNMYVLDEYKHSEIANLLKISVGTSKSNLARAKNILQERVESWRRENAASAS